MQFVPPFARWLKQQRKALGLTQAALASRTHYATITIRKIEEGRLKPSREMTLMLADALQVPADGREDFIAFARGLEARHALRVLPALGAPIIDRQNEMQQIGALLLRDDVRLVTLLGPPGVGKTRLAIEIGHRLVNEFPEGACFVPLVEARHAGDVAPAIATALRARVTSQQDAAQVLLDALEHAEMLLILDNFEHVLDAGIIVNELLMAAPNLTVLATSRAPLDLLAEHRFDVQPLAVPSPEAEAPALQACPSVQLFAQHAQAVKPAFALTPANLQPVAEICAHLEGLPLAIELAAGRTTMFTPRTIASRLRTRDAGVLTMGVHASLDAPNHHRTLHATIAWSYQMLDNDAKRIFRSMSVFAGGFSLPAAAAVCEGLPLEASDPTRISGDDEPFLRHFETLLNHNLIRRTSGETDEDMRFDLLQTLREFALDELISKGEDRPAQQRHAAYYARLADAIFFGRPSREDALWLRRMRADRANLQTALAWCMAHPDHVEQELLLSAVVNHALWVGGAMWGVNASSADIEEWLNHIELIAMSYHVASAEARAKALHGLVERAVYEGDEARINRLRRFVARLYRETGDPRLTVIGLYCAGFLTQRTGDLAGGLALYQQACEKARAHGLRDNEASALGAAGVMAFSLGDDTLAESNFKAAIAIYRALGLEWCIGEPLPGCLSMLAMIEQARNNPEASLPLLEESRDLYVKHDIKSGMLPALIFIGRAHLMLGRPQDALAALRQAAPLCLQWSQDWVAVALALMAGAKLALGEIESAARLAGAASRAEKVMQAELHPRIHLRDDYDRILGEVRRQLNNRSRAAWEEGASLRDDEAVALAMRS
jgi:predicted ATPase/DNA-binding XRE family transcriptional regulator/uncharacterized protein YbjQ (UPF0145 family)